MKMFTDVKQQSVDFSSPTGSNNGIISLTYEIFFELTHANRKNICTVLVRQWYKVRTYVLRVRIELQIGP